MPMDLRYIKRPKSRLTGDSATARVTSYLQSVYESVAETLPDIRDDGVVTSLHSGTVGEADNYAKDLSVDGSNHEEAAAVPAARRGRKYKFSLKLHQERHPTVSGLEVRFLPPGVMRDYWETMKAADEREHVSFKCFWATWHCEFPHLKFRPNTSHSQCSVCLHHKLLIRELANHYVARQKQTQLMCEHLMSQYRDRQVYWQLRGSSRLGCNLTICCILDGMDQCKFMYPRSSLCQAKDLSSLQRPKLHVVGMLVHGWGLLFGVSNHDHKKDASSMVEILAFTLTKMKQSGIDLGRVHLHCQTDNTARECKNATFMRFLSACVSHRVLSGASLGTLRTGHSHEDIDQIFGSLAIFIVRQVRVAETPDAFLQSISRFANGAHRPRERVRLAFKMDHHRDW